MYVYGGTDPEYENNLQFFLREAVRAGDNCDYFIVVQEGPGLDPPDLPPLPPNARVISHSNECFDLGTIGWLLSNGTIETRRYKHFLWLNSSVRGPFLPAYMRGRIHWTRPFTDRLRGDVKLVGPSISCGGAYNVAPTPHVQSYLIATDAIGLAILRGTETVFGCWRNLGETVIHGEMGASAAILAAGYNIDCLLIRYQGLDWRNAQAGQCNEQLNPIQTGLYDGISISPLEVVFIKVKRSMVEAGWGQVAQAVKYDAWTKVLELKKDDHLTPAVWEAMSKSDYSARLPALRESLRSRGRACFDATFYINASHNDLAWMSRQPQPAHVAFAHFLNVGLREGRPYRFIC